MNQENNPPLPPFTLETAIQKVHMAEDAWNTRDPEWVALAYTPDNSWRNRSEFLSGREAIVQFLHRKWAKELDCRLIKELWAFRDARIAVWFAGATMGTNDSSLPYKSGEIIGEYLHTIIPPEPL